MENRPWPRQPPAAIRNASATEDGISRWDAVTGALLPAAAGGPDHTIFSVATSGLPDGRVLLAGAGNDGAVYRWDADTGQPVEPPLTGHDSSVKAVTTFTAPDGSVIIVSSGDDETIRRWDAVTGSPVGAPLAGHEMWVTALAAVRRRHGWRARRESSVSPP